MAVEGDTGARKDSAERFVGSGKTRGYVVGLSSNHEVRTEKKGERGEESTAYGGEKGQRREERCV